MSGVLVSGQVQSDELLRVDEALRQMCAERDLVWLIDQVDTAACNCRINVSTSVGGTRVRDKR